MSHNTITPNSLRAWILAARPKTLPAALVPVMIGLAKAWSDMQLNASAGINSTFYDLHSTFSIAPALLCILFALVMQVAANFVNDYFDWRRGNDEAATRLGPLRACTMGWITPRAMQIGILVAFAIAGVVGLPLIFYGGWQMLLVGLACVVFCVLYTTTLSYIALGDVLVLVFFGLVPVCLTYYLQTGVINSAIVWLSVGCGLMTDCLLLVNNYRDIDNDRRDGKRTLVVFVGKKAARALYLLFGFVALAVSMVYTKHVYALPLCGVLIPLHMFAFYEMKQLEGRELNKTLGNTARNILIYGILTLLLLLL